MLKNVRIGIAEEAFNIKDKDGNIIENDIDIMERMFPGIATD